MEISNVPPLALAVFAVAWLSALGLIFCGFLITRRLGMEWQANDSGQRQLSGKDMKRVGKILWGAERAPAEVRSLAWLARGLWILAAAGVIAIFVILLGAAQ